MATTALSIVSSPLHRRPPAGSPHRPLKAPTTSISATRRDNGGAGSIVDENMIVLRMRIHETKMAERNYKPPSHWMEWEKQSYTSYDSDVCEVLGLLQSYLLNTRPSVAVGMVALLVLSVPTSMMFASMYLIQALSSSGLFG